VRILHLPVFAQRFPGKGSDVFLRFGNGFAQRFIGLERRGHKLGLRHCELVDGQFCTIKFFSEFQQRVVAVQINVLQDGPGTLFNFRIEQARGGCQCAELAGKIRVGMANDFHTKTG